MSQLGALDWASIGAGVGNHLWQSTVFLGVCWLVTRLLRKNHASIRHWIWLVASLKFLFPFSLLVGLGGYLGHLEWMTDLRSIAQPEWSVMETISQPFEGSGSFAVETSVPIVTNSNDPNFKPWFMAGGWFLGFTVALGWGIVRWKRLSVLMGKALPLRAGREVEALERVQLRQGGPKRVRMASSVSVIEPGVYGYVQPVLLLPVGISDRLNDSQLEAIIAHELCHIRRGDNLAAAIHLMVETIFWFHPLVWWIGSRLVDERERACDEEVVRLGNDPHVYAGAILRVCEFYVASPLPIVSGVTGSNLKKRIEEIMTQPIISSVSFGKKVLLLGIGIAFVVAPIAFGMAGAQKGTATSPVTTQPIPLSLPSPKPEITPPTKVGTTVRLQGPPNERRVQRAVQAVPVEMIRVVLPTPAQLPAQMLMGPEDELEIVVWRQPEISRRVVVRPDGRVSVPLLGDIVAVGLTPQQLSDKVRNDLKSFVAEPQVTVIVAVVKSQGVTILGAIAKPGAYLLARPTTVIQLIGQAGGLTEFAKRELIAIIRQEGTEVRRYPFNYTSYQNGLDYEQNIVLKAGDTIVVP